MDTFEKMPAIEFKTMLNTFLCSWGLVNIDKVYDSHKELYRLARKKSEIKFGECIDKKQKLLELIENRECLKKMDNNLYENIKKVMPYIIKVHEAELKAIEKQIDYVDLFVKLEFMSVEYFKSNNKRQGHSSIPYCTNTKDDNTIVSLPFLGLNISKSLKNRDKLLIALIHDLFHIIDAPIISQNCKQGIMFGEQASIFYKQKNESQNLVYHNEGNTVRRTGRVVEEMIKDGYNFDSNCQVCNCIGYIYASGIIIEMMQEDKEFCEAIYGDMNDLNKFLKNNGNASTLEKQEEMIKKHISW